MRKSQNELFISDGIYGDFFAVKRLEFLVVDDTYSNFFMVYLAASLSMLPNIMLILFVYKKEQGSEPGISSQGTSRGKGRRRAVRHYWGANSVSM